MGTMTKTERQISDSIFDDLMAAGMDEPEMWFLTGVLHGLTDDPKIAGNSPPADPEDAHHYQRGHFSARSWRADR